MEKEIRKKVEQLFTTLLVSNQTDGTEENELIRFLDCDSINIVEDFFLKSSTIKQYRALSFIIDEGFFKNCFKLMPLLKKIQNGVNDEYTHYFILPRYIELCKTKEDMVYVVDRLLGKYDDRLISNLYWGITGMSDKQLDILASFDTIDGYPLYIFDKSIIKDIEFFKKEILNEDEIYQEVIFLAAVIRDFTKNQLLKLVNLSKNTNLIDWYK